MEKYTTFINQATTDIKNFFLNNLNKTTPLHTVRDASKTSFQGFIISYMAQKKNKMRKQNYNKIFADLKKCKLELQQDPPNPELKKSLPIYSTN